MIFSALPKHRSLIWFHYTLVLIAAAIVIFTLAPHITSAPVTGADIGPDSTEPVVADFWQWQSTKTQDKMNSGSQRAAASTPRDDATTIPPALNHASIEQELMKIKVDENGDLLLDREASNRMAAGFQKASLPLDPELMKDLKYTITRSLPAPLGHQVAGIISDYHDYLVAVENEQVLFGSPTNLEEHKRRLQQKMELQSLILGETNASKLFAQENADLMYMLEGMQVATNKTLTPQQRQQLLAKLEKQRQQMKPSINNWDSRYEQFERNREAIEDAGLSNGDKTIQIETLYRQSFDMAERAQIEEMGAVSLN